MRAKGEIPGDMLYESPGEAVFRGVNIPGCFSIVVISRLGRLSVHISPFPFETAKRYKNNSILRATGFVVIEVEKHNYEKKRTDIYLRRKCKQKLELLLKHIKTDIIKSK